MSRRLPPGLGRIGPWLCLLALLIVAPLPVHALRVMTYNLLRYPGTTGDSREDDFRVILAETVPDLLITQEITSSSGATEFLNDVLNTLEPGAWALAPFVNGPDMDSACYYRISDLDFVDHVVLSTSLRNINGWVFQLDGIPGPEAQFRIYSVHLKASQGGDNEARREQEAQVLRTHLNGLPSDTNIIVGGDFNIYSSSEAAWAVLTGSQADNDGRMFDPIDRVGNWHNNASYANVHTQSTRTTTLGDGGATGGLDDRFDMLLINDDMQSGPGVHFFPLSYRNTGQDGSHFNLAVNSGTNGVVSANVANALHAASDHLPVYFDVLYVPTDAPTPSVAATRLYPSVPNPFNPRTTLRFDVARSGNVQLAIYDVQGRLVRTLVQRHYAAGRHETVWDGRDSNGVPASSGIYHYRLQAAGTQRTQSMVLLR